MHKYIVVAVVLLSSFVVFPQSSQACSRTLTVGDRGPEVSCVQQLLTLTGDFRETETSDFYGDKTRAAVARFQNRKGIVTGGTIESTGYGRFGTQTQIALYIEALSILRAQLAVLQKEVAVSPTRPTPAPPVPAPKPVTPAPSPKPAPPVRVESCLFQGSTLPSGSSTIRYQLKSVAAGNVCKSEVRTCTNGVMSGGMEQTSCVVEPKTFTYNGPNNTIDLRKYFPTKTTNVIKRKSDGSVYSSYVYGPGNSGFQSLHDTLMNQGKSGEVYTIQKRYGSESPTCTPTYATLFFGDDKSVTEIGDWLATDKCKPNTAFGYYNSTRTTPSGLAWSLSGGLRTPATPKGVGPAKSIVEDLKIYRQTFPGDAYLYRNASTWNEMEVVETLPEYTPAFGRDTNGVWAYGKGKTYKDVVRLRFYHGPRSDSKHTPVNCSAQIKTISESFSGAYKHRSDYHTYTSEFYMAPGKGIIQETLLYVEDGTYWNQPNCTMGILFNEEQGPGSGWHSYIDE